MRLVLVRHAESTWNASGRWQGQSDVPLSPRGRLQVRALAARMYGAAFDGRVSSDLSRARETAGAFDGTVEPDPRFREIDVGRWAGMARSAVAEAFPEEVAALRAGQPVRIGGGESMEEFEARVDAAIAALSGEHDGRVLVVTHGGVIRAATTGALGVRGKTSPLVGVKNTSISELRATPGGLVVERFNDAAHLDPADDDSAILRAPIPMTRVALVGCEPVEATQRLADTLLTGLGVAHWYATASIATSPLAELLLAEPLATDDATEATDRLRKEHELGVFGLLAPPDAAREVAVATLGLGRPEGLAPLAHAHAGQLRVTADGAVLHSWGLPFDEQPG